MKDSIFLSFPRLRILNELSQVKELAFTELKTKTQLTSGNLHSHCNTLIKNGYLSRIKKGKEGTFAVYYSITPLGLSELSSYLAQLSDFVDRLKFKIKGTYKELKYALPPSILLDIEDQEGNSLGIAHFD